MVQSLLKIGLQFLKSYLESYCIPGKYSPLVIYPRELKHVCTETVMGVFKVVLFMIVKMHKQPKYLSVEWIIKGDPYD